MLTVKVKDISFCIKGNISLIFLAESSTPVIRKASGLSSLIQGNQREIFILHLYIYLSFFRN
jgi:hypothetical protein